MKLRDYGDCRRKYGAGGGGQRKKWKREPDLVEKRCTLCGLVQLRFPASSRCLNMVETTAGRDICRGELR